MFEPMALMKDAISKANKPCVGWSGGKCSTAVLHMALQINPQIQVMFVDTGVEFPESYAFIKRMTEEWHLNLKTYKPLANFWDVAKKYGMPQFRTIGLDRKGKKKAAMPRCCLELKEKTLKRAVKEIGMDLNITGIRLAESRSRSFLLAQKGQYYFAKSPKYWQCHPIAFWTLKDLNDYLTINKIPENELYSKGQERTGCWPCTGFKTWNESLARSHPKMHEFVSHKIGMKLMTDYMKKDPIIVNIDDDDGCPTLGLQIAEEKT